MEFLDTVHDEMNEIPPENNHFKSVGQYFDNTFVFNFYLQVLSRMFFYKIFSAKKTGFNFKKVSRFITLEIGFLLIRRYV